MNQQKRGKAKVYKASSIISKQEFQQGNDRRSSKYTIKAQKKAFKKGGIESSNNQKQKAIKKREQPQNDYEELAQDQFEVQNQSSISQIYRNMDEKFQRQVDKIQKQTQLIQKNKNVNWKKYQKKLQQKKDLYQVWLKEMKQFLQQNYTQLKINFNQKQVKKQMTEIKESSPETICKELNNNITYLNLKIMELKFKLEQELRKKSQNKCRYLQNQKQEALALDNFYKISQYKSKKTYINMISKASEIIMRMNKKQNTLISKDRDDYVNKLKLILYKTGRQYLSEPDPKKQLQNYNAWIDFKQIFEEILSIESINFLAFRFDNEEFDLHLREMFIQASFANFKETYKNTKLLNKQVINYKPLSQLSIRKSHIYCQVEINQLEEMVQIVKNSWYIKFHLAYYIKDREQVFEKINIERNNNQKKKKSSKTEKQTFDSITKLIQRAKVYFIDYAMLSVNGITLTSDPLKQYPIFINFFSFFENKNVQIGYIQSYTLFLLVHELAHSIIRNYNWINAGESSNPFNLIKDNKKDGGWLLQHLIFGGAVEVYSVNDYQNVKELLKLEHCPLFLKNYKPVNEQLYKQHHQKIKKTYQNQKTRQSNKLIHQNAAIQLEKPYNNNRQQKKLNAVKQQAEQLDKYIKQNTYQLPRQKSQEKIKDKKTNQSNQKFDEEKFKQMQRLISSYGLRKLESRKLNENSQLRSLKLGSQSQFRLLNLCCGTHINDD